MKKIMFNDRYGLTKAVLEGRKIMTRRIIKAPKTMEGQWVSGFAICKRPGSDEVVEVMALDADGGMINNILPKYKPGEVVAVARSYNDIGMSPDRDIVHVYFIKAFDRYRAPRIDASMVNKASEDAGWGNKMFVRADLMPDRIRITGIRIERLQDISEEDCFKEGIYWDYGDYPYMATKMYKYDVKDGFIHPKAAFAALIDKVSGKGTWQSNPWVFVYEFELVK